MEGKEDSLNRKMSRRDACLILAGLGGAAAGALFGVSRIDPYALDIPPISGFDYSVAQPYPAVKYFDPTSGEEIKFTNQSTDLDNEDPIKSVKRFFGYRVPQPLSASWYVDGKEVDTAWDYSTKLPASSVGTRHKVGVRVSDGRRESYTEKYVVVDPDQLYPISELDVKEVKGMVYWVDPQLTGGRNEEFVKNDMSLIKNELDCNGIRLVSNMPAGVGLNFDWFNLYQNFLIKCAEMAIEKGFSNVTICPRYRDATLEHTKVQIREFAKQAEKLREISDTIVFEVGTELSIDAIGICTSPSYEQRAAEMDRNVDNPIYQKKLADFLKELISISRESFDGKLSYAAHPGEWAIPWGELDFDIIGQNQYWWSECTDEKFVGIFQRLRNFGKPLHVTEFGCATYDGAFQLGGAAYRGTGIYNEDAQAEGIKHYLDLINQSSVDGCFIFYLRAGDRDLSSRFSLVDDRHRKKALYRYKAYQKLN